MRPQEEYEGALALIDAGHNDCEISRRTGIPRGTIRDWRHGRLSGSPGRTKGARHPQSPKGPDLPGQPCPGCRSPIHHEEAYVYLFGAYLGDGSIATFPRGVFRLRITCDLKYPEIINEIATCMAITRGSDRIGFGMATGCVNVSTYWKHWPCLFPQHGPGRKHERHIELASWQRPLVAAHPKMLIRGLIHSDGCRHINEVARKLASGIKRYRYPRYMFTNASEDILGIFTDALDRLGVHWTRTNARNISVARGGDVAFLDTFVGPKR